MRDPNTRRLEQPLVLSLEEVERSLYERYGDEAFMYVEYPHKRFWRRQVGYERVGYNHFARASDDVARACRVGRMQWNRLGVTPGRYTSILGLGVRSTSTIGPRYYSQVTYDLQEYAAALAAGRFPISSEHQLDDDDQLRREIIESLRSFFRVEFARIEARHGIRFRERFAAELDDLDDFIANGILTLSDGAIEITEFGQQFANLVCSCFDRYRRSCRPEPLRRCAGQEAGR